MISDGAPDGAQKQDDSIKPKSQHNLEKSVEDKPEDVKESSERLQELQHPIDNPNKKPSLPKSGAMAREKRREDEGMSIVDRIKNKVTNIMGLHKAFP